MCQSSQPAAPAQPTQVSQVTIPEYAQPYAERMLGKAEAITGAPYQTYGGQRIAEATAAQQAARQNVQQMQQPGQFQTGTGLVGAGGTSALGYGGMGAGAGMQGEQLGMQAARTGRQALGYGGMGAGLGALASGAGQDYFSMATSPQAQQAFMSPYVQNVIDVQKAEAIRDAQKQQLAQNLAAARTGTYGGARQLLAGTERERALGTQLANIQATGLQNAFQAAQQAQQYGSTLGLQGLQTGIQGAGLGLQGVQGALQGYQAGMQGAGLGIQGAQAGLQGAQAATQAGLGLGQLGTQQQQTDIQRAQAQEQFGALGQAEQQRALDQAYQDFITQQQYPYKQLGFMSDILRGSANLAGTGGQAIYQAPPSMLSQVGGLGLGALGLYNLANK